METRDVNLRKFINSFKWAGLAALAAGLTSVAGGATQSKDNQGPLTGEPSTKQAARFEDFDKNKDRQIDRQEFSERMQTQGMGELATVFGDLDINKDERVDEKEFGNFQPRLAQQRPKAQSQREAAPQLAQQQHQPQQQRNTQVQIKEKPAQVEVQAQAPQVSVQQQPPKVNVEQAKPQIKITQPKPEVQVEQAKPQVDVKTQPPKVVVENATKKPQVEYGTAGRAGGELMAVTVGELTGKEVLNTEGNKLGTISKVVRAKATSELGVVLESGGFLGMGDTDVVMPIGELSLQDDKVLWQTSISRDRLQEAEDYHADRYQDIDDDRLTLQQLIQEQGRR